MNLQTIIEEWIGENVDTRATYEYGYYNQALADLRSRVPELVDLIRVSVFDPDTLDRFKLDPYELSLWFNSLTKE